jgi:uncharacterized protein
MSQFVRQVLPALLLAGVVGFAALPAPPASGAQQDKATEGKQASDEKKAKASFEVYKDKGGEYRWRLRSMNKQILATSGEGYKEKRACLAAIESVKKAAAEAPVVDEQTGS